jgi:hypothetical protein
MSTCINHPGTEAHERCAGCGRPFCPSCLVDFLGHRSCGACRDYKLAQMQPGQPGQPGPSLVFSPQRRQKGSVLAGGIMLALILGPMLLGLLLMAWLAPGGRGAIAGVLALGGIVAGFGGALALAPRVALLGNDALRRDMAAKIAGSGVPQAAEEGLFVGISPGIEQRSYDGDTHWDVGFLLLQPGWLAYYGDQIRFALRPDQVERMEIDPPRIGGPLTESRLLLYWRAAEVGLDGVLSVAVRAHNTRRERRDALEDLRRRIEAWKLQPAPPAAVRTPLPPVSVPRGTPVPVAAAEPGLWLAVGIPFAVVAAVGAAVLKRALGIDIPTMALIPFVIVASMGLAQAIHQHRQKRKG